MEIKNTLDFNEEVEQDFVFTAVDDPAHFSNIFQKENFKVLEKWGLIQNMELIKFRFNTAFDLKDLEKFLKDFIKSKAVINQFSSIELLSDKKLKLNKLSVQATNLDILNPIYENNIANEETGYIKKDFEDYIDEILICDKLKACLVNEDSEYYSIFNEDVRNEFLFHIFKRIVLGGSLCQYEDTISEYLEITKKFYKGNKFINLK